MKRLSALSSVTFISFFLLHRCRRSYLASVILTDFKFERVENVVEKKTCNNYVGFLPRLSWNGS